MATSNITVGAEYLHYEFDDTFRDNANNGSVDTSADVIRGRVNVKFNSLASAVELPRRDLEGPENRAFCGPLDLRRPPGRLRHCPTTRAVLTDPGIRMSKRGSFGNSHSPPLHVS